MTNRLLEVERTKKPKWTGSLAIVPVARDVCLRCGGLLVALVFGQLPLFRSHGYGAVVETTVKVCEDCRASFVAQVIEVNPRRYVA